MEISKRDYNLLRIAKIASRNSNAINFRLGAVVAKGREILGVGANDTVKTHPRSTTPNNKIHAELAAIINARTDLRGATLYVFRSGFRERPLLAKPCKHCQALIKKEGIEFVCYSTTGSQQKVATTDLN